MKLTDKDLEILARKALFERHFYILAVIEEVIKLREKVKEYEANNDKRIAGQR